MKFRPQNIPRILLPLLLVLAFAGRAMAVINDPIFYLTCDAGDTSGVTATDRGSGGNNGTLVNSPGSTTGQIKQALTFNGSTQSVTIPLAVSTATTGGDCTFSAWIYINSFTSYAAVFDSPSRDLTIMINNGTSGWLSVGSSPGAPGSGVTYSQPWTTLTWQHLCVVRSGTTATVYRNGVVSATSNQTGTSSGDVISLAANTSGGGSNLNGNLDEVRIYNRALSPTEVTALFNFTGASSIVRRGMNIRPGTRSPISQNIPAIRNSNDPYVLITQVESFLRSAA